MVNSSYKFLSNVPMGEDLFEGKSQEKIANVLSEVLQKNDFQIIGIDGGWGTGKSNLVRIVEKKLIQEFNFFIYDVWGHQEDDQRKAILVELTEYIVEGNKNVVEDEAKWKEKLKKLLAKEKQTTISTIPFLSVGFIISLILIIYVPTVNTFAKDLPNNVWKSLLVLAPVFVWILVYFIKVCTKCWSDKHNKGWKRLKLSFARAAQEMMMIYANKQTDETKIETISEREPSVRVSPENSNVHVSVNKDVHQGKANRQIRMSI